MSVLLLGLLLFLGAHSLRLFAPDGRNRQIQRIGQTSWKRVIAVVSLVGFGLICWGFGLARQHPLVLYVPPLSLRHLNALFTLLAFILVGAAYVPRNHLTAGLGHPMLAGTALWAFGICWRQGCSATCCCSARSCYGRSCWSSACDGSTAPRTRPTPSARRGDVVVLLSGFVAWAAFAFWLHSWWIGVSPFGWERGWWQRRRPRRLNCGTSRPDRGTADDRLTVVAVAAGDLLASGTAGARAVPAGVADLPAAAHACSASLSAPCSPCWGRC